MNKLEELYQEYRKVFKGYEIVTGYGNPDSGVVFIGEAPGRDEVRLSRPFAGSAGKKLDELLSFAGIDRNSIYITNAIKYRLSRISEKTGRKVNRPAVKKDLENNREYLAREINIIRPQLIVTLGNVPLKVICNDGHCIGNVHGSLRDVPVLDRKCSLFPLYHPASLIYNRALETTYREDMQKLKLTFKQLFIGNN